MSIYYEIQEHLTIQDTTKHTMEVGNLHYRLSLMAAWILQHRGSIGNLTITADGETFRFAGDVINDRYQKALDALCRAEAVEIICDYGCSVSATEIDPTPFEFMSYLTAAIKEDPDHAEGLFYCVYNNADCNGGAGAVCAYGKKNGVLYNGEVDFEEIDEIPDGDWYAPQTAIVCEVDAQEGRDLTAIAQVCRQLCRFSPESSSINGPQLTVSEDSVTFFTNDLRIRNDDDLKTVMELYAQLIDLTQGECGLIGELVDISGPSARILHFDVEADGAYTLKMAAIAE